MSHTGDWDGLPDVAYYYTTRDRVAEIQAHGLPAGAIANSRVLTDPEARELCGLAADA